MHPRRPATPSYKGRRPASGRASHAARGASRKNDTRCEVALRSRLFRAGVRFRKNVAALPGKPDIVFPRQRLAVFCDGDFWHGKGWQQRRQRLIRGTNAGYWVAKIEANMARDRKHQAQLQAAGWTVLRLWESEIHEDVDAVVRQVLDVLFRLDSASGKGVKKA